jgi:IclR family transcriptional regulator, pca regulon regulatory protein
MAGAAAGRQARAGRVPSTANPRLAGDSAGEYVQSLDRGLAVIRAFTNEQPRMTIADVARETGLTRAAARRFLHTLASIGYVGSNGGYFYLRPRVLELGYAYLSSASFADIAQEHLVHLAEELHESCSASVLDLPDIVYVARAQTSRIMTIALAVGTRLPAYATSMGRVLLASLPAEELDAYVSDTNFDRLTGHTVTGKAALRRVLHTVGEQGFAIIDQELELGVRSAAAPVRDAEGKVIAAINVSAHASRVTLQELRSHFLPALLRTAGEIDHDLRSRL